MRQIKNYLLITILIIISPFVLSQGDSEPETEVVSLSPTQIDETAPYEDDHVPVSTSARRIAGVSNKKNISILDLTGLYVSIPELPSPSLLCTFLKTIDGRYSALIQYSLEDSTLPNNYRLDLSGTRLGANGENFTENSLAVLSVIGEECGQAMNIEHVVPVSWGSFSIEPLNQLKFLLQINSYEDISIIGSGINVQSYECNKLEDAVAYTYMCEIQIDGACDGEGKIYVTRERGIRRLSSIRVPICI